MRQKEVILIVLLCAALIIQLVLSVNAPPTATIASDPTLTSGEENETFGAESNPTGSPIGGGKGYRDIVTSTDTRVNYTVETRDELFAALQNAENGDVIYIDETAQIDLTDVSSKVTIPAGVTLASNRGEKKEDGTAVYSFEIGEPGDYIIWGLVSAPDDTSDSFWISVDGEKTRQWNLKTGSGWHWSRGGPHYLSNGQHTLTIHWREDGSKLDRILITGDADYHPRVIGEVHDGWKDVLMEAESAALSLPMDTALDSTASGGTFISVPEGVGYRGFPVSPGGRIFLGSTDRNYQTGLIAGGEGVRITGIRLEGPTKTTDWVNGKPIGIYCSYRNLEVDNCEIWGWSGSAISIYGTGGSEMETGGYIHHNYIHHCQMDGLGYGVVVSGGAVCLVEGNYFNYCRHAIAGTGVAGDGYEARYNICGPNAIATSPHTFDMHGTASGSGTIIAGDEIWIHHNTFLATSPLNAYPVAIRGVPRVGAYIEYNRFYYTQDAPVWQTDGTENVFVTNNLIGGDGTLSESGPIKFI